MKSWTVGPNWPSNGEIDIIEGVNSQSTNSMTLHTGPGCSITNNGAFSGTLGTTNCDINAAGQATNAGCQINTPNSASYGSGFNAGQGGVYATEWTSQAISIWFFPRSAIPSDIASGSPDPTSWGAATASFAGGCNVDQFFNNQQIVFDTTFCGDWAGNVWNSDPVCSSKAATCQAYVQNNPADFADAFWSINSLKVYQSNGASTPAVSASASAGVIPSISVPAPIGPSQPGAPIPNPTSFATVATGAPQPPASQPQPGQQSFSFSHHSHGGGFTNTAIAAPTGTNDGVVVSSIVAPVGTSEAQVAAVTSTSSIPSEASPGGFFSQNPSSSAAAVAATSTATAAPTTTTAPVANPQGQHPPHGVQWVTVSALEIDQFPSEGETQTRGTNGKRWIFVGDDLTLQQRNDENEIMNKERDESAAGEAIEEKRSSTFGSEADSIVTAASEDDSLLVRDEDLEIRASAKSEVVQRSSTFGAEIGTAEDAGANGTGAATKRERSNVGRDVLPLFSGLKNEILEDKQIRKRELHGHLKRHLGHKHGNKGLLARVL